MKLAEGKVAVVTGAASGIGKALAMDFARRGMKVMLADIEQSALDAAAKDVADLGGEAHGMVTDVSQWESVEALAKETGERFGAVHVVCNNAGVLAVGRVHESPLKDWEWMLNVNLWGVIHGVRAFVPRLLATGEPGHIVNTASMAGFVPPANHGAYNASKFAVVGLSETLSRELRDTPVGVSILCPGVVDTGIFTSERVRQPEYAIEQESGEVPKVPGGRVLQPHDVSTIVLAGIEAEAPYIFPHGEAMEWVEKRHERVRRAFSG